ncbi:MAG: tetratricopeptide repeat protein [Candidatus Gastranaerophilales bacterium]|nr:tetratricopeptide repeat protein [Candidatus Gastranaerophilales bacterium]
MLTKQFENKIKKMQKKGDYKKAVDLCSSELQQNPSNADLYIKLGDLYFDWHQNIYQPKQFIDEAITEYQRALEIAINSAEIHYKIGQAFYLKGELDKAINHINIALEYDDKHYESYLIMARIMSKKDKFRETYDYAQKAVKFGGIKASRAHFLVHSLLKIKANNNILDKLGSFYHLAMSAIKIPFETEAQKEFLQKLGYAKFLPLIFKGFYYVHTKQFYEAVELYTQAIEIAPGFTPLYALLGDTYKSMFQYEDAINEFRMVLWNDPLNVLAYRALCQIYEETGDYDNAVLMYEKLIELNPNNPIYHSNLANIYYMSGNTKEAVTCYYNAIMLNPSQGWTSIIAQTLGYVFQESEKNYDAAIASYQNALHLTPRDVDIYINLGSVFYDKGDYQSALAIYNLALDIAPEDARIHCNLGYLYWGRGDNDNAIKEYKLAVQYDPSYDIAFNNLGVIYLDDSGLVKESIEMFDLAAQCNPNYALAYYNKARATVITGDKIEAARLFQIAMDLNTITQEIDPQEIQDKIDELFN